MEKLSFAKTPSLIFFSNRQFEEGEKHITRIYDLSVLILMRKGILKFKEDGKNIELCEGEYYIQRPFLLQEGIEESNKPNYTFIHFKGHYSRGGSLPIRGKFNLDEVQKLIDEFENLGDSCEHIEKEVVFYRILISLKRSLGKASTPEIIKEFIIKNYTNKLNIKDISKKVYLSKNQIINIFRSTYGLTPYQFLLETRLQKACEKILSSNDSIKQICYEVGFTDYSTFYKLFISRYKVNPFNFRILASTNQLPKDLYRFPEKESGYTFK